LRKALITFIISCLSVRLPTHLSPSISAASTGRISMKFNIDDFHHIWLTDSKFG